MILCVLTLYIASSTVSAIHLETPAFLSMQNVLAEAERFALLQNVKPEKVVLLITHLYVLEKVETKSSLLVLTPHPKTFRVPAAGLFPVYIEVLAANMKVIVASLSLRGTFMDFKDLFDMFRHNLLLHVFVEPQPTENSFVTSNTLYWNLDGSRWFTCVKTFDNLFVRRVDEPMKTCVPSQPSCSTGAITVKKFQRRAITTIELFVSMRCNETTTRLHFNMSTIPLHIFDQIMLYRYSLLGSPADICFTLIRLRKPGFEKLIESVDIKVGILTLLSTLILARMASRSGRSSFLETLDEILMDRVPITDVDVRSRSCSQMIATGSALLLCFFVAQVLNTQVKAFLTNPQELTRCADPENCHYAFACYMRIPIMNELLRGNCLCNLDEAQQNFVGRPLRRHTHQWKLPPLYVAAHPEELYVYFMQAADAAIHPTDPSQLSLNPLRVSSTLERLLETGVVARVHFEPKYGEVKRERQRNSRKFLRPRIRLDSENGTSFLAFNSSIKRLSMDAVRQLIPLAKLCAITLGFLITCELLLAELSRIRFGE